jgi:drug/metabolite transporter (DMT)-like permease
MAKSKTKLGVIYGILGSFAFGGYILINRYVYTNFDVDVFSYTVTFSVWAGAFALLNLCWTRYQKRFKIITKSTLPVALAGVLAGLGVGLIVIGGKYTTAINVSILATSSIIPTVLFSRYKLKERMGRGRYFWILTMLAGLYLAIVGLKTISLEPGDIIILASAVILGYSNVVSKLLMKKHSSDFVSDIRLISAGALFGIFGLIFIGQEFFVTNASFWPAFGGLAYWLTIKFFYASVRYINPSKAIVLLNGHTAVTPIFGVLLLSESYSWPKFIGAAIILISIFNINRN